MAFNNRWLSHYEPCMICSNKTIIALQTEREWTGVWMAGADGSRECGGGVLYYALGCTNTTLVQVSMLLITLILLHVCYSLTSHSLVRIHPIAEYTYGLTHSHADLITHMNTLYCTPSVNPCGVNRIQ